MLLLHISIALTSIAFTTFLFINPSKVKLGISYGLMSGTLISGTLLVISNNAHLLQACATGIVYTAGVLYGTLAASRKLAAQIAPTHDAHRH